jgi:hypothetical protein
MLRLIEVDLASTRKPYLPNGAPPHLLNVRALNALLREGSQFGLQIVTHEIQLMDIILIGRVERGLCRRQSEDQPATTRIHGFEPKDVAEKCAVSLDIFTVDNDMSPRNHSPLLRNAPNSWQATSPPESEDPIEIKLGHYPAESKHHLDRS